MQMTAHVHNALRIVADQLAHSIASGFHGDNARRRIMTEPECMIAAVSSSFIGQFHNVLRIVERQDTNKVERTLRTWFQACVDRNKRVTFAAFVDLFHVRSPMLAALHGELLEVVLVRVVARNVKII